MKEKQIEEMANDLSDSLVYFSGEPKVINWIATIENLISHGHCKQRKGEWDFHKDGCGTCNRCGTTQKNVWDMDNYQLYCGHCGASMRGALKMLDE